MIRQQQRILKPKLGILELAKQLVLQRRIAKYGVLSFVFGHEREIAVRSCQ